MTATCYYAKYKKYSNKVARYRQYSFSKIEDQKVKKDSKGGITNL